MHGKDFLKCQFFVEREVMGVSSTMAFLVMWSQKL